MDIQTSKLELVKLILSIDNHTVIEKMLNALKSHQEDFWLDLTSQEKQEIEIGLKQLDAGQRISLDDFLKKVS